MAKTSPPSRPKARPQSLAEKRQLISRLYPFLEKRYGKPRCPLHYNPKKPYELAIAVILSAQCTDDRVNQVTPVLFKKFPNLKDYYQKPLEELEGCIYSTGFYKNKAKNIRALMEILDKKYQGQIPKSIEELVQLPGIGRKTANVILNELFEISEGIVVDTHVARISRLWGLTEAPKANAVRIERDLMEVLPPEYWMDFSLYLVFLGREFCFARKPNCKDCFLQRECPAARLDS